MEKVKGESDSAGLNEQASREGKKEKKKVKSEFPEGAKRTVIGMEDERGGVSFLSFSCFGGVCGGEWRVDVRGRGRGGGLCDVNVLMANFIVFLERSLSLSGIYLE